MEHKIARVEELLETKKSKIGNGDASEVACLIYEIYSETNDEERVIHYLYEFPYRVTSLFFRNYYIKVDSKKIETLIDVFIKSKRFTENTSGSAMSRGFTILSEIIKKNQEDPNILVLVKYLTRIASKKETYSTYGIEYFSRFLGENHEKFFGIDFSNLEENEIRNIFRYVSQVVTDIDEVAYGQEIREWSEKYRYIWPKNIFINNMEVVQISELPAQPAVNQSKTDIEEDIEVKQTKIKEIDTSELMKSIHLAKQEVDKIVDTLFMKNSVVDQLRQQINHKEKEVDLLRTEMENKESVVNQLHRQVSRDKLVAEEQIRQIQELKEGLKMSYSVDQLSKNQELLTLKNNIGTSIKLQYEDFNEHKDEVCNEDNYEALKVMLGQIFRTLKKYGIEL